MITDDIWILSLARRVSLVFKGNLRTGNLTGTWGRGAGQAGFWVGVPTSRLVGRVERERLAGASDAGKGGWPITVAGKTGRKKCGGRGRRTGVSDVGE